MKCIKKLFVLVLLKTFMFFMDRAERKEERDERISKGI